MRKADVLRFYKSTAKVARVLGCGTSAIKQWPAIVPRGSAYELQVKSRGRLRVDPTLYGKRRGGAPCSEPPSPTAGQEI